jgi:hypothetical protein
MKIQEGTTHELKHPGNQEYDSYIEFGFQIATFQGPLCAEPVEGIAYFVQSVEIDAEGIDQERGMIILTTLSSTDLSLSALNHMSQVTGSLITAVKEACRSGLLDWSPRLKMAMYSCDIQASSMLSRGIQAHQLITLVSGRSWQGIWGRRETTGSYHGGRDKGRHIFLHRECSTPGSRELWFRGRCVWSMGSII